MSETDRQGAGTALLHTALVAFDEGRLDEAQQAVAQALVLLTEGEDPTGQAAAHQLLAMLAVGRGSLDEAEQHLVKGLELRQKTGDVEGQVSLLTEAFRLYLRKDEVERAGRIGKLALQLAPGLAAERRLLVLEALVQPLVMAERFPAAVALVRESGWLDPEQPALGRAAATLHLVQIAVAMGEIAEAARGSIELVAHARNAAHPPLLADALHQAGAIAAVRGDLPGAHRLLVEALDHRSEQEDEPARAFTLVELGSVESAMGQLDAAQARLMQAARILEAHEQPQEAGEAWHALAQLAERRGDLEGALRAGDKVLALVGDSGDMDAVAAVHFAQGVRHAQRGALDEAEAHFRRSVQVQEAAHDKHGRAMALAMLGQVVAGQGRIQEAVGHLQAARGMVADPASLSQIDELLTALRGL